VSAPSLPDDPHQWPEDPFQLLGVSRNVNPHELRRAYARLIRLYKPEQFPEQFRRVRAAYEVALRLAEFVHRSVEDGAEPDRSDKNDPQITHRSDAPPQTGGDEAVAFWEMAIQGDEARAYAALAELERNQPHRSDLAVRLYWLLTLRPDLEPKRSPVAWLATALQVSHVSGPAVELYRQELGERPGEALAATERLLEASAPPVCLTEVAEWRWQAAGRLKRWDVMAADMERLRERVRPLDEASWLRLQLVALDHVAWEAGTPVAGELLAYCRRELTALEHLAIRFPDAFDRLEYLLAMTAGWRRARDDFNLPPSLLELIPQSWVQPFADVRPQLVSILNQISAAPRRWLRHFDSLEHVNALALSQIGALLAQYQDRLPVMPSPHGPQELAHLAQRFFEGEGRTNYEALRSKVIAFCLRECVGPELVAAVVPPRYFVDGPNGQVALAAALSGDWPLRAVCWACRLFWA
jgi:hypothetical protein